jgi:FkbM family methyltransferase
VLGKRGFIVRLRPGGLRFQVRTALDAWIVKETCLDRDYERASVPLQDGWVIVDIGAGIGDFAIHAAAGRPHTRVLAFEPAPDSFELLQRNMALNGIHNVEPFAVAVSGVAGHTRLDLDEPEPVRRGLAITGVEVPTTTLDRLFEDLSIACCDFLKIDTEGAEYEILFNTSPRTLERIARVSMEFHEGVTPFGRTDLVRFFESHSFRTAIRPNPVHPTIGLLYAWRPV